MRLEHAASREDVKYWSIIIPTLLTTISIVFLYLGAPLYSLLRSHTAYGGASCSFAAFSTILVAPSIILVILGLILKSKIQKSITYTILYSATVIIIYVVFLQLSQQVIFIPLDILRFAPWIFVFSSLCGNGPKTCYYPVEGFHVLVNCLWSSSPQLATMWITFTILLLLGLILEFTNIYIPLSKTLRDNFIVVFTIPARILSIPALLVLITLITLIVESLTTFTSSTHAVLNVHVVAVISLYIAVWIIILVVLTLPYAYITLKLEETLTGVFNTKLLLLCTLTAGLLALLHLCKIHEILKREQSKLS